MTHQLQKVIALAGAFQEKLVPHNFRHSFVRMLLERVPVGDLTNLAGDTEHVFLSYYAKWIPSRQACLSLILKEALPISQRNSQLPNMPEDEINLFDEELQKDPYEVPPITGELWLSIDVPEISLQSKKTARLAFEDKIREETQKYKYLLSGDITVDMTLQVHQRNRYETDASPDLDNFLKPLLDSLSGPKGILIDDCQVRTLSINWISWKREDTRIELFLKFIDDDFVNKDGLLFVQMDGPLCMPVDTKQPLRIQRIIFAMMRFGFRQRRLLEKLGADYYFASSVLSIQRRFHRTRINGFPVKSVREYKRDLRMLRLPRRTRNIAEQ